MASRSPGWLRAGCFLLVGVGVTGCGRAYDDALRPPHTEKTPLNLSTGGTAAKKLDPLKAAGFDGTLTGRVVFKGAVPTKRQVVPTDKPECLKVEDKNDIYDQDWYVGEGQGVKNVVIFLKPPDGVFFPVADKDKFELEDEAAIDQPFCAFHPQVAIHHPVFFDEKGKLVPTGQKPTIRNSGAILHNANLQNADPKYKNPTFNVNVPPGTKKDDFSLNYQPSPLSLSCSIHPWMKAHIWVFDHPYAVRTNDKGEFTLSNLPTGVDLQFVCWHPSVGFFGEGESAGRKMNFKSGKSEIEIPISPR